MGHHSRASWSALWRPRIRLILRTLYPSFELRRGATRPLSVLSITFVLCFIATGVYLVVPVALLPQLRSRPTATAFKLVVFLWCISCTVVSYLLTALASPGKVPDTWKARQWQAASVTPSASTSTASNAAAAAAAATTTATTTAISAASITGASCDLQNEDGGGVVVNSGNITLGGNVNVSGSAGSGAVMVPVAPAAVKAAGTSMIRNDGQFRYCMHCKVFKPDRAHHCSSCDECVLLMDHHCPFTGDSCIGFLNRKFFVLFLYYATASCTLVATLTPHAIMRKLHELDQRSSGSALVTVIAQMMGYIGCSLHALVLAPFAMFHTYLVVSNRTTIEKQEARSVLHDNVVRRLDRGWLQNWKATFGPIPALWLLPISYGRAGDGTCWRRNDELV